MRRSSLFQLSLILRPALLACATDEPRRIAEGLSWSVDTLSVIGVAEGDANLEFGRLIAGELSPAGEVALLDLMLATVSLFDGEGRAVGTTRVGSGPGELRQPWALSMSADGQLYVLDLGNRRISRFALDRGALTSLASVPLQNPARELCLLGDRIYVGFTRDESMAHEIGSAGEVLRSFAEPPPLPGLEKLGAYEALARQEILKAKLYCDLDRDQVIVVGTSHPLVRAYDPSGTLRWEVTLPDIAPIGFQIGPDGALGSLIDREHGANFVRSMVPWDDSHLLIQYEVRRSEAAPDDREFYGIDSRLIALDTGVEVARTAGLPHLAAARGERYLIVENVPYPRALVVERRRVAE
jgi:hypothetical protein